MNNDNIHFRKAVRTFLITPKNETLLIKIKDVYSNKSFWITPGGGIEDNETIELAIRRELNEELGLKNFDLGDLIWYIEHTFDWGGKKISQNEKFYVVNLDKFDPVISNEVEKEYVQEFRWWKIDDIERSEEDFAPKSIVNVIKNYLKFGKPKEPIELQILFE